MRENLRGLREKLKHKIPTKENECDDLKKTVSNLEKLLDHERDERNAYEKNTMGLLEDVKKKWHNRYERIQKMCRKSKISSKRAVSSIFSFSKSQVNESIRQTVVKNFVKTRN